jgi:Tol biopolymer transport system component
LAGTEAAYLPFWSPDSQQIAFVAGGVEDGNLKAVAASGGAPRTICNIRPWTGDAWDGGSWNAEGTIVFANGNSPIFRVPASGGEPRQVTHLDAEDGEVSHSMPQFLPDGRHFVFWTNHRDPSKRAIWVGSLNSPTKVRVTASLTMPRFAKPDYLLFPRGENLFVQHFDLKLFRLLGTPKSLAEDVSAVRPTFSASDTGVLVYRQQRASQILSQLVWYSRDGKRLETVGDPQVYSELAISPDQKRVAVGISTGRTRPGSGFSQNIYLLDFETRVLSRLTLDESLDATPVWTPDSRQIVYVARSGGPPKQESAKLMERTVGEQASKVILETDGYLSADTWNPNGTLLLLRHFYPAAVLSLARGEHELKPTPLSSTYQIGPEHISADGRWMAYASNESSQFQVYVTAFPSMTGKRQISTDAGCLPFWGSDGRELFYVKPQGQVMSADVRSGVELQISAPKQLFQAPRTFGCYGKLYGVDSAGKRFLFLEPAPNQAGRQALHVVLNWDSELR